MKKIIRPFQLLYCIYALLVFAMLTIFSVVVMLLVLMLDKKKLDTRVYKICRYWGKIWYLFIGVKHEEIHEGNHQLNQAHVFVSNHNSYMDILPVVQLQHQPIKPLGKYESSKIPIFGLIYKAAVILVDRSSPSKRAQSLINLKSALKKKISIFIFPEGTFSMTDQYPLKSFYNGAFKLAIEMNVPIQPVLMIDAVDRMHYDSVFTLNPGPNRVVFLETVQVEGYTMEQVEELKEKVFQLMDNGLRRYRNYPKA